MIQSLPTTYSQSKRLLRAGIDASTSDGYNREGECSWSVGALLDILPKRVEITNAHYQVSHLSDNWSDGFQPVIAYEITGRPVISSEHNSWIVDYEPSGFQGILPQSYDLTEALVQALELLAINGYNFVKLTSPKK